jgi:23S rRNA pseudouridine1911/1915/1917 synthase
MEEELRVRYEDSELIVADKPAGMHTAPLSPGDSGTLLELVMQSFPEVGALPGIKAVEPGLVHRLDRETSGLVVVARTAGAFDALRRSFASGEARKDYTAACADDGQPGGTPPRPSKDLPADAYPRRHLVDYDGRETPATLRIESRFAPYGPGRRMVRPVLAGERSAKLLAAASPELYCTEARILERRGGRALLSAWIRKGFRHQVRAHLAFLGFPILGDPFYGAVVPTGFASRMYLHAARIELAHPATGRPLVVESPVPEEFTSLFEYVKGASP